MIALANLLIALGQILSSVVFFFLIITFIRAIVSWVNADPHNPIVRFLIASTDPLLRPIRRYVPPFGGGLDLSPLILVLLLMFINSFVAQSLMDYGTVLKRGL